MIMKKQTFYKIIAAALIAATIGSGTVGTVNANAFTDTDIYAPAYQSLALDNTSYIESESISLGSSVMMHGSATGGAGDYTYAVLYKKTTDTSWVTKQNFTTNTTVTVKPSNVAAYDLCVKVKDADGTIVKKFFTFCEVFFFEINLRFCIQIFENKNVTKIINFFV